MNDNDSAEIYRDLSELEYDEPWEGGQYPEEQTRNADRRAIPTREVREAIRKTAASHRPSQYARGAIEVGRRMGLFTRKEIDELYEPHDSNR